MAPGCPCLVHLEAWKGAAVVFFVHLEANVDEGGRGPTESEGVYVGVVA